MASAHTVAVWSSEPLKLTSPQQCGQLASHVGLLAEGGPSGLSSQERGERASDPPGRWGRRARGPVPLALPLAAPQVNLLVPVAYLVFWAFLLVFSFISEPMVCGVGVIIILTGVPIFFLGVFWRSKPKCVHRLTGEPGSSPMGRGLEMEPSWGLTLERGLPAAAVATRGPTATKCLPVAWPKCPGPMRRGSSSLRTPVPQGQTPGSICRPVCLSSESMTRWGQELCFVVYPQGSPEEEENGPCQPSPLPAATDKPLKTE